MGGLRILSVFVVMLALAGSVMAADGVVINSREWTDVYSGVQYSVLKDIDSRFLTSERQATLLPTELTDTKEYDVIEGSRNYAVGYANVLRSRGTNAQRLDLGDNINVGLARKLADEDGIDKFILVDDNVGYNALAAAPYAALTDSFVLFATPVTIEAVSDFLAETNPEELIVYGHLRREVMDQIEQYNPDVIDLGSRFANNVEIMKRYRAVNPVNQTLLSNGEFIENELMRGINPVMFIGKGNVPPVIEQFIKESKYTHAVLIGNELVGSAAKIKNDLGISVFVKFARSSVPSEGEPRLIELERFPVPVFAVAIDVIRASYNDITGQLEVRYRNLVDTPSYFKSTITIPDQDITTGDEDTVFIDGLAEKTVTYAVDIPASSENPVSRFLVLYGEAPESIEFLLEKNITINRISVLDESDITITRAVYDKVKKGFLITVDNPGENDIYATAELIGLKVDEVAQDVASGDPVLVPAGGSAEIVIRQVMSPLDLEDNTRVDIKAYFGQRETALVKTKASTLDLEIVGPINAVSISIAVAVIILLLILILFFRRRKKQ